MYLLELVEVSKHFHPAELFRRRRRVRALDGVSLQVGPAGIVAVIGQSGSGKSTLARLAAFLIRPTSGRVLVEGHDVSRLPARELRLLRRRVQIVFQDTSGVLDPRQTVGAAIAEPLANFGVGRQDRLERSLAVAHEVGLTADLLSRFPHELSGGQRQRVGLARALVLDPRLLVLDEPVSALDVSVAAQILNLLADRQARSGLSYLFVTHDLHSAAYLAHRIAVLYAGQIVEIGPCQSLLERPLHPYTQALLRAAIDISPPVGREGYSANLRQHTGCRYRELCELARQACAEQEPELVSLSPEHWARCHLV